MSENEPAQPPTRELNEDFFLQMLVSVVNKLKGTTFGITLTVGGALISGDLIDGKSFFDEFAKLFEDGMKRGMGEDGSTETGDAFRSMGNLYDEDEALQPRNTAFIHLKNARHFTPGSGFTPTDGTLWRGRISSVDGFSLGMLTPEQGK